MTGWFFWAFAVAIFLSLFSCLLLARITMAGIDRKVLNSTGHHPCAWDEFGVRLMFYAYGIVLPERQAMRLQRIFDVANVRKYATRRDKLISIFFFYPGCFFLDLFLRMSCSDLDVF